MPEGGGKVQACSWEGEHADGMQGKGGLEKAAWNRVGLPENKAGKRGNYVAEEQRDGLTEDFLHLTDRKLKNFGIFIQTRIKTKHKTSVIEQISPISHPVG